MACRAQPDGIKKGGPERPPFPVRAAMGRGIGPGHHGSQLQKFCLMRFECAARGGIIGHTFGGRKLGEQRHDFVAGRLPHCTKGLVTRLEAFGPRPIR